MHAKSSIERSLFNGIQAAVVVHAADTSIIDFNQKAMDLLGLTSEQLRGKMALDEDWKFLGEDGEILPPERYPVNQVLATGKPLKDVVLCIQRLNGMKPVWVNVSVDPLCDATGRIEEMVVTFMDVTKLRESRKELEQSHKLLLDMLDAMPDMVWLKDPDGAYISCNQKLADLVDSTREAIIGGTDYDIFPQEKAEHYTRHDRQAIANRATTVNEESADYLHEEYAIWIETSKTPVYDTDGKLIGVLGVGHDISRTRQTLQESQERQGFLTTLVDSSPLPLLVCSPTWVALQANQAFYSALQTTAARIIGKYNLREDGNFTRPDIAEKLETLLHTKKTVSFDLLWKPERVDCIAIPAAPTCHMDVSIFPLLNSVQEITHIIVQWADITEHWKAEEKLHLLFENSPIGICTCDQNGNLVTTNMAYEQMLGYSKEELCGMSFFDITHPDYRPANKKLFQELFSLESTGFKIEKKYIRKDGAEIDVELNAKAVLDRDGKALFGTAFVLDVTESKRALEALRTSEELLREAQNTAHIAHWTFNPGTGMPWWSEELYRIYDRDPSDGPLPYEKHPELVHPDDWEWFDATVRHTAETGAPFDIFLRIVRPDGSTRVINSICKPVIDDAGAVIEMRGTIQDVTKLKQAEAELIQSKELIDSVINGIPEPIFVKDEHHHLIMLNDAFGRMLGSAPETLLGKTDYDLFTEHEADTFRERDRQVLEQGEPDVNEETLTVDGQTHILSTSKSVFTNPITGQKNIVGITRDITENKALADQLQQAQRLESVGRLAGGVAHDYNNMLSVIIGYSESALEKVPPEDPVHDELTEILKAGNHSAEITRQLLAFARRQTIAPQVLNLNDSIEGLLKMLRRLIGEDIDLAWLPGSHVSMIQIDPAQIDQILANLCINARDAIANVGTVTIETKNISFSEEYCRNNPESLPGDYVMLAISDSGSGIDPDVLEQIFEPFFTTKERYHGTGLGLATVYGIVKQNRGFIHVYSEMEEGTTIKCYFPVHEGSTDGARITDERAVDSGGNETILLVEDDKAILKLSERILTSLGYTVLAASSPHEAIQIAETGAQQIDLLLTDVIMPEMNGRELADRLHVLLPGLKTLFMSGYTANIIAHRGVLDKGVHFLEKPLSKKTLSIKIREALETHTHN